VLLDFRRKAAPQPATGVPTLVPGYRPADHPEGQASVSVPYPDGL
jgi:hypothetical protein